MQRIDQPTGAIRSEKLQGIFQRLAVRAGRSPWLRGVVSCALRSLKAALDPHHVLGRSES